MYNKTHSSRAKELELEKVVVNCFLKHNGNYGRPRIKAALEKEAINISEGKIARIMKKHGLVAKAGRRRKRNRPKKTEEQYIRENLLLGKDLKSLKRNEVWSTDITEMNIKGSRIYMAGIIDVASKRLVGYHIDTNMRQELVHQAIKMATCKVDNTVGIIFHSDRGSQYTSRKTQEIVKGHNMIQSMSRPSKPNDNQAIESLWNSLKTELDTLSTLSRKEAIAKIFDYVGNYYNEERIHSSIGYNTPDQAYAEMEEHKNITPLPEEYMET